MTRTQTTPASESATTALALADALQSDFADRCRERQQRRVAEDRSTDR